MPFSQKYFMTALQPCPFSQFNTPIPCLQQIPTEINGFEILFFLLKMLYKKKLSNDKGFISIYSFLVTGAENFLIIHRIYHIAPDKAFFFHQGASNEYQQNMFSWRNKKNILWIPLLSGTMNYSQAIPIKTTTFIHC